nr:DUF3667 domain-containing protein [Qipengyuania sphaerica]
MVSRAVDGDKGAPLDKGHFAEGACLNCGTELIGSHCHACGQKAHLHRTLGAFIHDLLHGALHFEGRTWKTLPKLLFKPGELTRRYIEGERARFVSPMALFLFVIFLMFAVFQIAGISTPTDFDTEARTDEVVAQAAKQIDTLQERRDDLALEIDTGAYSGAERTAAEARLKELDDQLAGLEAAQDELPILRQIFDENDASAEEASGGLPLGTGEGQASGIPTSEGGDTTVKVDAAQFGWLEKTVEKWRASPELMLYKLQTNFYKFSWLLIPLSIPFVWLLFFWKRRFRAYDHAIFVTYSLSFMTPLILGVTLAGLAGLSTELVAICLLTIPPLHMYKQLRGAYSLSRFSALWRLAVLTVFILVILLLFLQLLLVIGAF